MHYGYWLTTAAAAILIGLAPARAADWPQWRGPQRDGRSDETGLLKSWPPEGPRLLWAYEGIGRGFSSVTVAGGVVYTAGFVDPDKGCVFAFDLEGRLKWKYAYGGEWTKSYRGPKGAPAVADGDLYFYSGLGLLICLDAQTGEKKWELDTRKECDAQYVVHGICESPLVAGDNVICCPGGKGFSVIAVNRKTGTLAWRTADLSEIPGYNSAILIERGGRQQIVAILSFSVIGLDVRDGTILWKHAYNDDAGAAWPCSTPVYADGLIYVPSAKYGEEVLALAEDGRSVKSLWTQPRLAVHHGGAVIVDGRIYATAGSGADQEKLLCLDLRTGKVLFDTGDKIGLEAGIFADGLLYMYFTDGVMRLVRPSAEKYDVISSFKIDRGNGPHWTHPSIANGRLYIRHGNALMCYDIGEPAAPK